MTHDTQTTHDTQHTDGKARPIATLGRTRMANYDMHFFIICSAHRRQVIAGNRLLRIGPG